MSITDWQTDWLIDWQTFALRGNEPGADIKIAQLFKAEMNTTIYSKTFLLISDEKIWLD